MWTLLEKIITMVTLTGYGYYVWGWLMQDSAGAVKHLLTYWPLYLGVAGTVALLASHWWRRRRRISELQTGLASLVRWRDQNIPCIANDIALLRSEVEQLRRTLDARVPPPRPLLDIPKPPEAVE